MTHAEAINHLTDLRDAAEINEHIPLIQENREALDMAIAALGKDTDVPSTDDLISRAMAQEEIARRDTTDGTVKVFCGREVNEILANLPSAQPEREECEEREQGQCPFYAG